MPLPASYSNASIMNYGQHPDRNDTPPFNNQENYGEVTCDGNPVVPSIEAKIEKGFFFSNDRVWTCYRRNYFAVNVSYTMNPWYSGSRLYWQNGKGAQQIQSLAVSLSAAVDGAGGKNIELIQHTPKRDKGPQLPMKKELLSPTPPGKGHDHGSYALSSFHNSNTVSGPTLPMQAESEASQQQYSPTSHGTSNFQHAFERIQFKSATANNGKRRAQQQYYHLIVELWANIQTQQDTEAKWVKIAARSSHPVVVRGRSPSHYSNEGHNQNTSRGTGSGGMSGPGHHGLGSTGGTTFGGYRNGISGSGAGTMGGGMYRGANTYSLDPSPVGSHSISSASSLSAGSIEGLAGSDQHMVDDEDSKMMESHSDYQYYPAPIYETIPPKVESVGLPLPLPDRRIKEEYPGHASMNWQVGGCGRFQGMETSRGYYPDVHTHAGY
jgi:meiosis-specific transcription factor NDT80